VGVGGEWSTPEASIGGERQRKVASAGAKVVGVEAEW